MRLTLLVLFTLTGTGFAEETAYRLPCAGRWFVYQGGDTINVNHHMKAPSQWYGLDLMKCGGEAGRSITKGDGDRLEDFYSWGVEVLSPVAGVVDEAHDGEPDQTLGESDKLKPFGNHVRIKVSDTEYVYLAHLQNGSVQVQVGQEVDTGDLLGLCGNSGNTTAPHIHMHVQNSREPFTGRGQNMTFHNIDVELSGKEFARVDWPLLTGLFVANAKEESD